MLYENAKEIIRSSDSIALAHTIGIPVVKKGNRYFIPCPDHPDVHVTNCVLNDESNEKGPGYYCHVCKNGGSNIDLVMKSLNMRYTEAFMYIAEYLGLDVENNTVDTWKGLSYLEYKQLDMNSSRVDIHNNEKVSNTMYSPRQLALDNSIMHDSILLQSAVSKILSYLSIYNDLNNTDKNEVIKLFRKKIVDEDIIKKTLDSIKTECKKRIEYYVILMQKGLMDKSKGKFITPDNMLSLNTYIEYDMNLHFMYVDTLENLIKVELEKSV